MNLQEVFDDLSSAELSNIALGGERLCGICEDDKPTVISSIQLGLTQLFKRFKLKEDCIDLQLMEDKRNYTIHSDYAISNYASEIVDRYLLDTEEDPYTDDLMKVERIYDQFGLPILLNKIDNPKSIRTTSENKLYIPDTARYIDCVNKYTDTLQIWYRANHRKIDVTMGQYASFDEQLELPETHKHALLLYVASRIMNPIGMTNEFHSGNSYYAKYEQECMRLEAEGLQIDHIGEEDKFEVGGFI